jgi:hypothetical protein
MTVARLDFLVRQRAASRKPKCRRFSAIGRWSNSTGLTETTARKVPVFLSATLVVSIASREGLVVVADKRTNDPIRGDLDSAIKISPLGRFSALSVTGTPDFLDPFTFKPNWSLDSIIREYYGNADPEIPESFPELARKITRSFASFVSTTRPGAIPNGNPPDNTLALAAFFLGPKDGCLPSVSWMRLHYVSSHSTLAQPNINVSGSQDRGYLNSSAAQVFGNAAVINELKEGTDLRFNDLREDKRIRKFLLEQPSIVSSKEALDFARFLIKVTSERLHLIDNSRFHVGPSVDCAIIGADGFQWVGK